MAMKWIKLCETLDNTIREKGRTLVNWTTSKNDTLLMEMESTLKTMKWGVSLSIKGVLDFERYPQNLYARFRL